MFNILLVPVIMACATGGTIGLLKIINKIVPGGKDTITREWEMKGRTKEHGDDVEGSSK